MSPTCHQPLKRKFSSGVSGESLAKLACVVDSLLPSAPMHNVAAAHSRPQHGAHSLPRLGRGSNEDSFVSSSLKLGGASDVPVHVLAVFDGHSSASVSTMLMEELPQLLTHLTSSSLPSSAGAADVDAVMPQVLQQVFEQLDARVPPLDNSGSTATVAVLTPQQIHLAWVGDSRSVLLGQGGRVINFTHEHRATREDETERVQAAGGTVLNNSGLRVMGILQCTRAIGDKDLRQYGVIPTPDVLSIPRTPEDEFLVLATDGLWDVVSNEEVYDYALKAVQKVTEHIARQQSPSNGVCAGCKAAGIAARALASVARKQRGSRDDITVMVANLSGNCSCANPPAMLSSATGSSSGLLASSSTGGATRQAQQSNAVASGVQLHSSPAALGLQPDAPPAEAGLSSQQVPQQQQQQQAAFKPPKQPQHSLPAAPRLPCHQQQQRQHKWRPGVMHGGLLLQPSVCPGPASAMHASAAFDAGPHHHVASADGLQHSLLSDLAMSSPFAMMLGGAVAEVDVVEVDLSSGSGSSVVSGGSAPPALNIAAAAALVPFGPSGLRKRSLSVALGNSRSCGSVGAPPLGQMNSHCSSEPPVVVLT